MVMKNICLYLVNVRLDIAPELGGSSKQGGQNKIGADSNGNCNGNRVPFIGTLLSTSSEIIFAK